jgi:hypothetical protein
MGFGVAVLAPGRVRSADGGGLLSAAVNLAHGDGDRAVALVAAGVGDPVEHGVGGDAACCAVGAVDER